IKEPGLIKVEGWYETPTVQHCHIENFICYAEMNGDRIKIVTSTQIPHIVRRVVGQALGIEWGKIQVIKPYIGGGFGNKQDVLYEPLCAWLCMQLGGHLVKLDVSREDTFVSTRVRHAIRSHIISWVRPDGTYAARKLEAFSDQGAYASHGHSICAKGAGAFPQLYPCDNVEVDAYTVFTNKSVAGAMRGYGIPQAMWAAECHTEEVAAKLGVDPIEFRRKNLMPVGYTDPFSKNELYADTFSQCMDKGMEVTDYLRKYKAYQNQTGDIRRGIGMAVFWYNTAVWPISLETSSCRMVLNQDGSLQVQVGETEIGQGADTAFSQMTADVVGVPLEKVHVVSCQDTDVTPFGTGAYASRQTYTAGFAIRQTGSLLKERILNYAHELTRMPPYNLDIIDGNIVRVTDGRVLMTLGDLATEALYSLTHSQHLTAESTAQIKSNAYSFGCTFAEVEVDIPMCKVKLLDLVNVHDAGTIINPALAEAQVHGGMSMGIGFGLSEKLLFDPKSGKALNNNLLDYKLSTFMDHPRLRAFFVENPEPTSAFGTKALGEPPTCSVAPAIRNAVYQATGVFVNEAPVNPHILFRRFKEEGLI
uniref:xanthine dehydrogenase subunit XdhA n=1 Tax=uncultured Flavonifractor sp. TaxID=1193534 RepID=UPI0026705E1F